MEKNEKIIGNEILENIKRIGERAFKQSLDVCRKLADGEEVSDGELLDAFWTISMHLDLTNPLLPLASEMFDRYMRKIGMQKTPRGIDRAWFNDDEWSDVINIESA